VELATGAPVPVIEGFFNTLFSSATLNGLAAFPNRCFVTAKPADQALTS
jgi:hypothetical protein